MTAHRRTAPDLPSRLWAAAEVHHDEVRRSPFVVALANHGLPWRAYADWLAQLYFLHESLAQAEAVMLDDPVGRPTGRSAMVSLPDLATDLDFLYGPRWPQRMAAYPTTTVYCTHLRDIAVRDARGFLAHHYARHMEDLHAAPDLAPAVADAYGLDDAGLRFLQPRDTYLRRYRDRYLGLLDTAPWSPADTQILLAVTAEAHQMYLDIVEDLGAAWA